MVDEQVSASSGVGFMRRTVEQGRKENLKRAVKQDRNRVTVSRVRDLRWSRGWTMYELSVRARLSVGTVRTAEHGLLLRLNMASLLALANALDCGVADLFPVLSPRLDR